MKQTSRTWNSFHLIVKMRMLIGIFRRVFWYFNNQFLRSNFTIWDVIFLLWMIMVCAPYYTGGKNKLYWSMCVRPAILLAVIWRNDSGWVEEMRIFHLKHVQRVTLVKKFQFSSLQVGPTTLLHIFSSRSFPYSGWTSLPCALKFGLISTVPRAIWVYTKPGRHTANFSWNSIWSSLSQNALYSQERTNIDLCTCTVCIIFPIARPARTHLSRERSKNYTSERSRDIKFDIAARREFHIYLSIWRGTHAEITTARASSEKKNPKGMVPWVLLPICSSGWILSRRALCWPLVCLEHSQTEAKR